MDDKRLWLSCEECDGEWSMQTDCDMKPSYCVFCGETIEEENWEDDEGIFEDSV